MRHAAPAAHAACAGGFHHEQLPAIRPMIEHAIAELGFARYGIYTFTPMALPLMQDLRPVTIAYDCMDELASFRFAPKQLPQRESALFRIANVVFTGGPSLYRAKRGSITTSIASPAASTPPTSRAGGTRRMRIARSPTFRGRGSAFTA